MSKLFLHQVLLVCSTSLALLCLPLASVASPDEQPTRLTKPKLAAQKKQKGLFQKHLDDGQSLAARKIRPATSDATIVRSRLVSINLDQLPTLTAGKWPKLSGKKRASLLLNLFPDTKLNAVIDKTEQRSPTHYTISGRLSGSDKGTFLIIRDGRMMTGEIRTRAKGTYSIRNVDGDLHQIEQLDESTLPSCGNSTEHNKHDGIPAERQSAIDGDPSPPVIDLMVVYTAQARAAAGGTAAMESTVDLFVAAANTAYANSQINARVRLVYAGEVAYTESGSANTDLNRLTSLNDGYLDQVHTLRDQHGADVVSLLVNDFDYCGIGWLHHGASRAFSVTDFGCGSLAFIHEIGHNMGCAHDRENAGAPGTYSYSYGYRFTGNSGREWRTVMAYAPGQRIQHFSNPLVRYDGVFTGTATANNALTVSNTAPVMASYRAATDIIDCNGNFVPDNVDLQNGTSEDCNHNNVPDECDIASGHSSDSNNNDVPDGCECDASACNDGNICTIDTCTPGSGACVHTTGAIAYGDLDYSGAVGVEDVSCVLAAYNEPSACPQADIFPCDNSSHSSFVDAFVDVDDLLAVLDAFQGHYRCESPCP